MSPTRTGLSSIVARGDGESAFAFAIASASALTFLAAIPSGNLLLAHSHTTLKNSFRIHLRERPKINVL